MARDDNIAAEGGKADHDEHRGTIHFDTVLESEHEAINARREGKSRSHIESESNGTGSRDPVYDTIGLALSGGGIRSAAFCLGALQALESASALNQVDYSLRSGGGYIGACWSGFTSHEERRACRSPAS
jgi:hypothetical protein